MEAPELVRTSSNEESNHAGPVRQLHALRPNPPRQSCDSRLGRLQISYWTKVHRHLDIMLYRGRPRDHGLC
jgi:hypothetical protein